LVPGAGAYLMEMLARVEGMPLESLREGVPWDWESFGDYLGKLDGRLAVNAGFLVGHSALRRCVMGERAVGEEATPGELDAMVALLQQSVREGGMGFSSSVAPTHNDGAGAPVPSRHANREELIALARAIRDLPGTTLEFIPGVGAFGEGEKQLMTDLSLAANRPLNWNVLVPSAAAREYVEGQLSAGDFAAERGATVIALTPPNTPTVRINLHSGFLFDAFPNWAELFRLPIPERKEKLRDPAFRKRLDEGANSEGAGMLRGLAVWQNMVVDQVARPENQAAKGRTIGELAEEQGKTPFDAMLDLALADDLKTSFMPNTGTTDAATWALRAATWQDSRAGLGATDPRPPHHKIGTIAF
jgi:N-acyl-D-aspartate/D-glutamate deacylase